MVESTRIEHPGGDSGYFVVSTKNSRETGQYIVIALVAYFSTLGILYGVLAFDRPEVLQAALADKGALAVMLVSFGVILISIAILFSSLGGSSFTKVKSQASIVAGNWLTRILYSLGLLVVGDVFSADNDGDKQAGASNKVGAALKEDSFSYGAASSDRPFETYLSNILKSLSAYAASSEETATKLLDKGVAFMAGGLVFYVVVIVLWQIFANLTHPDPNVMYVGMAACSMTFIVVEFLAAWFFKQYRYYVEVSLSCLRVRSVYDRYLLSYYSLREFEGQDGEKARGQMVEILKEDVKWPKYKGAVENDFNYMVESVGVAHKTMESMRKMFKADKKASKNAE